MDLEEMPIGFRGILALSFVRPAVMDHGHYSLCRWQSDWILACPDRWSREFPFDWRRFHVLVVGYCDRSPDRQIDREDRGQGRPGLQRNFGGDDDCLERISNPGSR